MSLPAASDPASSTNTPDGLADLRQDVRDFTRSVDVSVLSPADDSALSAVDRARIALAVARVNDNSQLVARFTERLAELDDADGAALVADPER